MANLEIQNISTLEDQGKVLSEQWAKIEAADKKRFTLSTKAEEALLLTVLCRVAAIELIRGI